MSASSSPRRAKGDEVPARPPLIPFGAIDPDSLRPLIEQVVEATIARLREAEQALPDRLAYSEVEAAQLLGLARHQLRDERRRGRIAASHVVGRQVRYLREDLMAYLMRDRSGDP